MTKTKKLTLSAILTALAFVLVLASKLLPAPWTQGGYITLASMVPVIMVSIIVGTKWGLVSGFVFSLIQLMTDFYLPPATTALTFFGVIMLDYVIAFTVLGLAGFFVKLMGNSPFRNYRYGTSLCNACAFGTFDLGRFCRYRLRSAVCADLQWLVYGAGNDYHNCGFGNFDTEDKGKI